MTAKTGTEVNVPAAAVGNPAPTVQCKVKAGKGGWKGIQGAITTSYKATAPAFANG